MGSMYTGPRDEDADDTPLREERARTERARRRDRASWVVVTWVMAGALALLSYDSGGAAVAAHQAGRPWLYPATVSAICLLVLVLLAGLTLLRRRGRRQDGVSHRGPG
jgi:cytochrome bd-type quinol oxidase subunit 2